MLYYGCNLIMLLFDRELLLINIQLIKGEFVSHKTKK